MFIDEITISARAGAGGDGVVRWNRQKFKPKGGPAGGNGGRGGDVCVEAVRDINALARYQGVTEIAASRGGDGQSAKKHGRNGASATIYVPVGARVTDRARQRSVELNTEGERVCMLHGGAGGYGNDYFKSSTNPSPYQATPGQPGEAGELHIELRLFADVGLVGLPNAGKSTLLNTLTNAQAAVGAYPFTTLSPHLGALQGYVIADIPGLIEGASAGKGLGYRFLRHIERTKMLLHVVSAEEEDPFNAYYTIKNELSRHNTEILNKEEWIIISKKDLVNKEQIENIRNIFDKINNRVLFIAQNDPESLLSLSQALVRRLQEG